MASFTNYKKLGYNESSKLIDQELIITCLFHRFFNRLVARNVQFNDMQAFVIDCMKVL